MRSIDPGKLLKKTLKLVLLLCLYFMAICVLLEIGLRLAVPGYIPPGLDSPNIWQYDSKLGWRGRPDINVPFRQESFQVTVQHNSLGHRAKEYPTARTAKKRMLVLGDSFVWCYGVESRDCFVDRLEARNPGWEIINIGIAGVGTDQEYLHLQEMLDYYHPDVVMLLFIQNDFQDNVSPENHNYYKPYFTLDNNQLVLHQVPVPTPRLDQTLERWIYGRSWLYNMSSYLLLVVSNQVKIKLGIEPYKFEPYRGFSFQSSHQITQALLNAMIDSTEQHHAKFVLVHGQMLELLQIIVKRAVEPRHVPLHNLDRAFEGHTHSEYQIPGDAHWNALGHQLVADDLDKFFHETGIFPGAPR